MELFHGHSDDPQKDLKCSEDILLNPSIDVQCVDKENVYNVNESLFRTICGDDLVEEKYGEVILEDENAEESWLLINEESDQGSSFTLAWSLRKRVEVTGTNHLPLEGGGIEFVADLAVAKNALGEYPDPHAQSVSAGPHGGCVSFLYERIEGVKSVK